VLTTPAIKAVRDTYPRAYIAMMVRPYTEPVVKDNPYLDEVIVYDKYGVHGSLMASIRFAYRLKRKKFDIAIIFHPTNRTHIITSLAGIPRRVGYKGRLSFLLTDIIENKKHEGKRHEQYYNLELLAYLGIGIKDPGLYLQVSNEAQGYVDGILSNGGIGKHERVVAVHPGASCPSKVWPLEKFAKLTDELIDIYGLKVVVVGGRDDRDMGYLKTLEELMSRKALFLPGRLNITQLAALLKRAEVFISNDSGPVHVAVAVGTRVLAFFGRNQPGLSPLRWGPTGPDDIVFHKDVGCSGICLAHNCKKAFSCLASITVEEVLRVIKDRRVLY